VIANGKSTGIVAGNAASRETVPIQIKGIDPALEQQVTDIKAAMQKGTVDSLTSPSADGTDGILVGKDLAAKLGVGVGDSVSLLTPQGTLSPMGMMPRSRRLRVTGPETKPPFQINDSWIHPRGVMEAWRERNLKERRGGSTVSRSVFKPSVRFSCPGLKYTEPFLRLARLSQIRLLCARRPSPTRR